MSSDTTPMLAFAEPLAEAGAVQHDTAISVQNLSKCYELYSTPRDRLKQFVLPRLQRALGLQPKRYFREFWALSDVSLEIKKGEAVGIIGRNGSGKSTLLQMICGTLNPTNGTIQTNGRIAALLELGSGFNPEFTGRENVFLNAAVLGLSQQETIERFDDIAAFADIGDFIDQPIKTYSSGMLVRLAFAVIAHVDADILVIDEALAVGDAIFVQKCNRFIRKFAETGTLLFVSHSMQSVLDLCDKSIWLKQGQVAQSGNAKDVVRHYTAYIHKKVNADAPVSVVQARPKHALPADNTDHRKPLLQNSNLKFKLELFGFDFEAAYWGVGGAEITDIEIFDAGGSRLQIIEDCGVILVRVHCRALVDLARPIVGINIRNQRGVELISDNSNLTYFQAPPPSIAAGKAFHADFRFFLPYLPAGDYTLGAAIADGVQDKFVQHQRRDDALRFSVVGSHLVHGIFAMPLEECRIVLNT